MLPSINIRVLGCGDAFCSGGRNQTSFFLMLGDQGLLLDCGATVLLALQQQALSSNRIDHILITHLHGDHFGGLPFLLLEAHFHRRRKKPLTIVGPEGTEARLMQALDVLYPDMSGITWTFPLRFIALCPAGKRRIGRAVVTAFQAVHHAGAPALSIRLSFNDKVIAFTGDTAWTETLLMVADDADLLISECHSYAKTKVEHLDWTTLHQRRTDLHAKRILLTHMGPAMLDKINEIDGKGFEFAKDGMEIAI